MRQRAVTWQDGKLVHCKYLSIAPYKALEKFSKALYGTTGGTYSARVFRPVMRRHRSQWVKAILAEIQPQNHQNVEKMHFWQNVPGVNGLIRPNGKMAVINKTQGRGVCSHTHDTKQHFCGNFTSLIMAAYPWKCCKVRYWSVSFPLSFTSNQPLPTHSPPSPPLLCYWKPGFQI